MRKAIQTIVTHWNDFYVGHIHNMDTPMGSLKPGATYIYERADGRIYAREFGSTDRQLVGYDSKVQELRERRYYANHINDVLIMCEQDPAMQQLLEQLLVLYNLKKTHE
jgi:hypothetical protein